MRYVKYNACRYEWCNKWCQVATCGVTELGGSQALIDKCRKNLVPIWAEVSFIISV